MHKFLVFIYELAWYGRCESEPRQAYHGSRSENSTESTNQYVCFFCFFVCAAVVCVWKVMHKHHVQQQYRDEDLEYTPTKMYFYTNKKNRHTMATITAQLFCATATASTTATIREKNGWSIRSNGSREEAKKEEEVIYCNNSIRAQIALSVPKPERKAIDLSVEGRN